MPTGSLTILLHGARDLHDTEAVSKMDPYAKIRLGDQVMKSQVKSGGGRNPQWNQTLKANVVEGHREMLIELFDSDMFSADDPIGSVTVELDRAFAGIVEDVWHNLVHHGKFAGQVCLRLTFTSVNGPTQYAAAPAQPQYVAAPAQPQYVTAAPAQGSAYPGSAYYAAPAAPVAYAPAPVAYAPAPQAVYGQQYPAPAQPQYYGAPPPGYAQPPGMYAPGPPPGQPQYYGAPPPGQPQYYPGGPPPQAPYGYQPR
ncbi:C2 domain-containing protein [Blastocladiella britannica]|nr:C2 domain-containing protein [Blastocladiella britannica]